MYFAQISVLNGFLLEMCAMMVCRYVELITAEHKRQWLILAVLAATMTALLIDYTGMYYHPISASACLLGCAGTNIIDHFKVIYLLPVIPLLMLPCTGVLARSTLRLVLCR